MNGNSFFSYIKTSTCSPYLSPLINITDLCLDLLLKKIECCVETVSKQWNNIHMVWFGNEQ